MRCLHCGKQLSLLRRASGSEFCSRAHQRQYIEVQESLAVARLIEARQDGSARPRQSSEAAKKSGPRTAPVRLDRFLPETPRVLSVIAPDRSCSGALEPRFDLLLPQTSLAVLSAGNSLHRAGLQPNSMRPASSRVCPAPSALQLDAAAPVTLPRMDNVLFLAGPESPGAIPTAEPAPLNGAADPTNDPNGPEHGSPPAAFPSSRLSPTMPGNVPLSPDDPRQAGFFWPINAYPDSSRSPLTVGEHLAAPLLVPTMLTGPHAIPREATLVAGAADASVRALPAPRTTAEAPLAPAAMCVLPEAERIVPARIRPAACTMLPAVQLVTCEDGPAPAGCERLGVDLAPDPIQPIQPSIASPALRAVSSAARNGNFLRAMASRVEAEVGPEPLPVAPASAAVSVPESGLGPVAEAREVPEIPAQLAPLAAASLDQLVARQDCLRPESLGRPLTSQIPPAMPQPALSLEAFGAIEDAPLEDRRWRIPWHALGARYRSTPSLVKWLAVALPIFLAPLIRFSTETASASSQDRQPDRRAAVARPASSWWKPLARRAAIRLEDDFRSGLGAWKGTGNWAESWSYDSAGLVHPGKLALYVPSMGLSDYRLEFTGQLERGGIGWAYRARDASNYHAMKLVRIEPGPLAQAVLVRYSVVAGRAGPRERTPLPFQLGRKSMHDVRLELEGAQFTVYVDGQLVHYGSSDLLPRGGVGFFAEPGDQFCLRKVRVVHQDDTLGRLCAWLAPAGEAAISSQGVQ